MGKLFTGLGIVAAIIGIGAALYLKTPAPAAFDREAAIDAAAAYDARVIRDRFGVPHIYGKRDADVAFGLAYAHAEDDWATIEEVVFFSRGTLAERKGKDAAIPDYLIGALRVGRDVKEKFATDLAPKTRAIAEAYAAGLNLWCAQERDNCSPGAAPVTPYDVIAGFTSRTPFFYGLDAQLKAIFEGDVKTTKAAEAAREAFLRIDEQNELGSNAIAVAPVRSSDGHTRLMVNSHQPYEGPVAWYEARLKSEEGWDIIGGLFPGAPMVLLGAGPNLGWAHTVNRPDLVDVYELTVDDPKKPTKYKFDGEWREFDADKVKFRVKLFGPFSLPVTRPSLYSVHGPVFITEHGVFAVSYAGAGNIKTIEQWYAMNKAQNFDEWRAAMAIGAMPSFNAVYADREGNVGYFYNAAIPVRDAGYDWSGVVPGDTSQTLWRGQRPFSVVPSVVNPASGYVVNANNTPFMASGEGDNPDPADFPPHFGISTRTTNRGIRLQELYGADAEITEEEFIRYKMDFTYAQSSRVMELVRALSIEETDEPLLIDAIATLKKWNGAVDHDNRAAALAILTAQKARGYLIDDDHPTEPDYVEALRQVAGALNAKFGRVDPSWGEVLRFRRGDYDLAIDGGPDTLRAVYPSGNESDIPFKAAGGDTYILYADWAPDGMGEIQTIHQFGAATLDQTSPHYADQVEMFVHEQWKKPPMTLEAVLAEASADYRPGRAQE
jgi:acyl-homoserine-lactone acylase